jgi:hypothetical protein
MRIESDHNPKLQRWLAAEAEASTPEMGAEAAEAALVVLFEALPRLRPAPGFAERVRLRVWRSTAAAPPRRRRDFFAAAPVRWLVAACLLLAGALLWTLPPVLRELLAETGWSGVVRLPFEAVLRLADGLRSSLAAWEGLTRVGRVLAELVTQPPVAAALLAALAVTALAFRLLHDLISSNRSWSYVEP